MSDKIEIYEKQPVGFQALIEVSACYIEIEGNILLLQQSITKPETGAWGVPAGKLEKQETPEDAAYRELFEETGIHIENASQLRTLGCLYIRKPAFDYVYHLFQIRLEKVPPVCISQEHQAYQWVSIQNLHTLNLMSGAREGLEYYSRLSLK